MDSPIAPKEKTKKWSWKKTLGAIGAVEFMALIAYIVIKTPDNAAEPLKLLVWFVCLLFGIKVIGGVAQHKLPEINPFKREEER
jgi:hypothetical protein